MAQRMRPRAGVSLYGLVDERLDGRRPQVADALRDAVAPLDKQVVVQVVLETALERCQKRARMLASVDERVRTLCMSAARPRRA